MLFLWLTGRFEAVDREPDAAAARRSVARELSEALTENPPRPRRHTSGDEFGDVTQRFAVLMRDGRRAVNRPGVLPPGFGERLRRPPPMAGRRPERGERFGDRERLGERMGPPQEPGAATRRSAIGRRDGPPPDFGRRRPGGGRGGPGGPVHRRPSSSAARRWAWSPLPTDRRRSSRCCASSVRR